VDYDLFRLNSRSFEQLIQVLAAKVLGQGIIVFGDGPDGGREATIEARVPYPTAMNGWNGYIVTQAKFRQRTQGTTLDGNWAVEQLRQELKRYEVEEFSRRPPEYLIFATNVTLSAVQETGAKDRMFALAEKEIVKTRKRRQNGTPGGLRGFDVWDYDKLRVYLDQFEDVRRSFGAYISTGDVMAEMVSTMRQLQAEVPRFDDASSRFLQKELLADRWANLEQAGSTAEKQISVSRVFIDLPAFPEQSTEPPEEQGDDLLPGIVAEVVEASAQRLDPRTLEAERLFRVGLTGLGEANGPFDGRVVLLGGPGQGKSTIGQFLCQVFRAAILRTRPPESLAPDVREAMSSLEAHCKADGLELPAVRRFPLRVVLSRFADQLADPNGVDSLIEYLAHLFSRRIEGEVTPATMSAWIKEYPWLLVLDGLDEVPASSNREEVLTAISEFWVDLAQSNSDALVVATTRPQGYGEEFSPHHYRHLWLAPLSTARALRYTDRLLEARFGDDLDRREAVRQRVRFATERPDTARLMTSPLQATIMTTLLEQMGKPPSGRWNLFSEYYRTIYHREREREIDASWVLREYKTEIDAIHRRVGLLLQVETESVEQAEPRISRERFEEVVIARLREEGHDVEANRGLIDQIIEAAMYRLVFLVGLQADQVGFELRSFQEFMAAEGLLEDEEEIEGRLRAVAPLPAWRNVFLFSAGKCFSERQSLRAMVHTICAELDDAEVEPGGGVTKPGANLALDLLADGVATNQPGNERLLARTALRLLRRPPGEWNDRLARLYNQNLDAIYREELQAALAVAPFAASFGAWRTLAGMGARGVEWAFSLLEDHLPGPADLGPLVSALPASAQSEWLGTTIGRLCAEFPPYSSLPFADSLRVLKVLRFTPSWFEALLKIGPAGDVRSHRRFTIRADRSPGIPVRLQSVEGGYVAGDWAGRVRLAEVPESWRPLIASLYFASSPSTGTLTRALNEMLEVEDFAAIQFCVHYAPWPLAAVVAAAEDREQLAELAELARTRRFGNLINWRDAERRWDSTLGAGDLAYPSDPRVPYDVMVGFKGFPLSVATAFAVGEPPEPAIESLLRALPSILHPPSRQLAFSAAFVLLDLLNSYDKSRKIDAALLADTLREGDLDRCELLIFNALGALRWSQPLSGAERRFLDGLGRRFSRIGPASRVISPVLGLLLARAWLDDPGQVGLYRLLAVGVPAIGGDAVKAIAEAAPPPGEMASAALLELKLRRPLDLDAVALEAIAAAPEPWIEAAIEALAVLDLRQAVEGLTRLEGALPAERWSRRNEIGSLLNARVSRRPSGLGDRA
jgi:hypothetical protein